MSADVQAQLRDAVTAGRPGRCLEILSKQTAEDAKALLDQKDSDHFTLLHRACASEQVDIMKIFLQFKANPNAQDSCGDTPLHWACFSGNLEAVNVLLESKADPLFNSNDGKTPLDAALEERHTHILQRLFDQPQVFEKRAVLESLLLRGPLALKEGAVLIPDRLNRYRVWKTHHVVLSSMVRAMFVCRTRAMAESWQDAEHFNFSDILAVRWVKETRKRYLWRRINVYVQTPLAYKLRIVQEASGMDNADDADALLKDSATGARELERVEYGSAGGDNDKPVRLKALRDALGRVGTSFRRRASSTPNAPGAAGAAGAAGASRRTSSPPRDNSFAARAAAAAAAAEDPNAKRSICIAFLADSKELGKRWYDMLLSAGVMGKSLCAVRIQTCFRKFSARRRLARMKKDQESGSLLVVRRGTSEDVRFVPLDANHTRPPPAARQGSVTSQQLSKYVAHSRAVEVLVKAMPKGVRSRIERKPAAPSTLESSFSRKNKSKTLALPTMDAFHNAEDEAGYLFKRGATTLVRRWKRRFVILSHVSAELQHYNPARKDFRDHVRRVPFSKMLAVRKEDKKGFALTVSSAFIDPRDVAGASSEKALAKVRRRALQKFEAVLHFVAASEADRDRWIRALARVLPRDNVAALKIQKVARGFLARLRIRRLKRIARMKATRKREEALHRIEEARQRAAAESEARAAHEELALLNQAQSDEREHRRRARAAKRQQGGDVGEWKEFTDKTTGRPYYYNRATKETVWVRPSADEWVAVADEASGKTYFVNQRTNETSWRRPPPATRSTAASAWESAVDTETGDTYYVNKETGESRWDLPAAAEAKPSHTTNAIKVGSERVTAAVSKALEGKAADGAAKAAAAKAATGGVTGAAGGSGRGLGGGLGGGGGGGGSGKRRRSPSNAEAADDGEDEWQAFTDPASRKVFYVNQHTGVKSWTKPNKDDAEDARNAWVAFTDAQGRRYYNNPVTGKTEWTLPSGHRLAVHAEEDITDAPDALVRALEAHVAALLNPEPVSLAAEGAVTPDVLFTVLVTIRPGIVDGRCVQGDEDCMPLVRGGLQALGVRVDAKAEPLDVLWELLMLDLRDRMSLARQPSLAALLAPGESLAALDRLHPLAKLERWLRRQMDENVNDLGEHLGDGAFKGAPGMLLVGLCCALYVADPSKPMPEAAKAVAYGKPEPSDADVVVLARHVAKLAKGIVYADRPECLVSPDWRLKLGACVGLFERFGALKAPDADQQKAIAELGRSEADAEERVVRAWLNGFVKVDDDVVADVRDGVTLCKLVDLLIEAPTATRQMTKKPEGSKQRLANISLALATAQDALGVEPKLEALDVADGKREAVLKYLWSLMRAWALRGVADSEQQLLVVANEKTKLLAIRSMQRSSVRFSPAVVESSGAPAGAGAVDATPPTRSSLKRSSARTSGTAQFDAMSELTSFRDGSLRTGVFLCALLDTVRPGCINWKLITPANSIDVNTSAGIDACEANVRYALCVAMKLGVGVYVTWRDVVDMNSRAIVILVANIVKADAGDAL